MKRLITQLQNGTVPPVTAHSASNSRGREGALRRISIAIVMGDSAVSERQIAPH